MEQQVLMITKSEDLVKLRALAKLCSVEFFNYLSLLVLAWRRILEVLVLAMPPVVDEKKARGGKKQKKKKKKADSKKLEILDARAALAEGCSFVGDFDDARRYYKRAKERYEEQLGPDDAKTLDITHCLIMVTGMKSATSERLIDLLERMERALGEENVLTLETLNLLGGMLKNNGEYEEVIKVYERCLAGQMKVLGEDHKDTRASLNNLGVVYTMLENYEKGLEYFERALKGSERMLGKAHPITPSAVLNIANVYSGQGGLGKAEEFNERALEGYEAQLGKDHKYTRGCAENFMRCLLASGNDEERLEELEIAYLWLTSKRIKC
ncbi:hypothetical protein TL16_g01547 [Triparma laevis f. inornata]|uniref:Kinesin light chain n=1 Tax=Triparma laevis f. inornata TaxID=1714386 RepID=A0A9W7DRT1_9STRA|nr:hypothetical protein TL16_g01547 [Triparma laevis f. inornata]